MIGRLPTILGGIAMEVGLDTVTQQQKRRSPRLDIYLAVPIFLAMYLSTAVTVASLTIRRTGGTHRELGFQEEDEAPREGRALGEDGQRVLVGNLRGTRASFVFYSTKPRLSSI